MDKHNNECGNYDKNKKCEICEKSFLPMYAGQKFCSVECRIKSTENKVECTCKVCGKLFLIKKSEVDKNKRHYCSIQCRDHDMKWSEEDINILIENFKKISYKDMVNLFSVKRSVKAISSKAITLGLTSSRKWSEDEIEILIDNYSCIPMKDVMKLLPNRSKSSILGQARVQGLKSSFYLNHNYSKDEDEYLINNYLDKSNYELGEYLHRSPNGIAQHLRELDLHRPPAIAGYNDLTNYIRSKLASWKANVRKESNYRCALTGKKSNIIIHHIRGFNLLMNETIEILQFPVYENISEYTQDQLNTFLQKFLQIQESYNSYICINEDVHKHFHKIYGHGNNTKEQWDEFVNKYYN